MFLLVLGLEDWCLRQLWRVSNNDDINTPYACLKRGRVVDFPPLSFWYDLILGRKLKAVTINGGI